MNATDINWDLHQVVNDFKENYDLQSKHSKYLKELKKILYAEARKFETLPLGKQRTS